MSKIQAQAGDSLADVYDVVGSIAGVEELESKTVQLLHEMGSTIFSERLRGDIRRNLSGAISQSTAFDVEVELSSPPGIVEAVCVFTNATGRLADVAVVIHQRSSGREIPIWVWDGTNEDTVRMDDDGGGISAQLVLRPLTEYTRSPIMWVGDEPHIFVDRLFLRGNSSAFGGGTVNVVVLAYRKFPELRGISSRGLPIPSW